MFRCGCGLDLCCHVGFPHGPHMRLRGIVHSHRRQSAAAAFAVCRNITGTVSRQRRVQYLAAANFQVDIAFTEHNVTQWQSQLTRQQPHILQAQLTVTCEYPAACRLAGLAAEFERASKLVVPTARTTGTVNPQADGKLARTLHFEGPPAPSWCPAGARGRDSERARPGGPATHSGWQHLA